MKRLLLVGIVALIATAGSARAGTTFLVTKTADTNDGACTAADCSLREALAAADANPGSDTVSLPAGTYVITLGGLDAGNDATVAGAGVGSTIVDGAGIGGGTWQDLTIEHGIVLGGTLDRVAVTGSVGGAIDAAGDLVLTDVTVAGNSGTPVIYASGTSTLTNVTVSGNVPDPATGGGAQAGAIVNGGTMTLTNVTVSGNTDGGIANYRTLAMRNVTITGNTGYIGNEPIAFYNADGSIHASAVNTIFDGRCEGLLAEFFGDFHSLGHNLDSGTSCFLSGPSDISGVDPQVQPLADNGGPTKTNALAPTSPAVDAGDDLNCPTNDQRGLPRSSCDIGAYELQTSAPVGPTVSVADRAVNEGDSTANVFVSLSSAATSTITVQYSTVDGSASAPDDYNAVSGVLTFLPGQLSQPVTIPIVDDRIHELPETLTIHLANAVGATVSGDGILTIADDDPYVGHLVSSGGVVTYTETVDTADDITVSSPAPGAIRIANISGPLDGCGVVVDQPSQTVVCPGSSVDVHAGNLDDRVTVLGAVPALLDGGPGSDTLTGGASGDTLVAGPGSDTLDGGGGTDTVLATSAFGMTLSDTRLTDASPTSPNGIGDDTLTSIERADLGAPAVDTLDASAYDGDATLRNAGTMLGGRGNDTLLGGQTVSGGPGTNTIDSAALVDERADDDFTVKKLAGGGYRIIGTGPVPITDTIGALAGAGTVVALVGGPSANVLDASGFDRPVLLDGLGGNDTLVASTVGGSQLYGDAGDDTISTWQNGARDDVLCGPGIDTVTPDATDNVGTDCELTGNTPAGTSVPVHVVDAASGTAVDVTFDTVSAAGSTTLTSSTTGPPLPSDFQLAGVYFDLTTTAAWAGATVCFPYTGTPPSLLHFEGGAWVNVTTTVTATQVCGHLTSFSPIAEARDVGAPRITCAASDGAWHGDNVSIACTATDGAAGLASADDAHFSLSTSVPAGSETANATTDTRQVCDRAGNCTTAGPITGIKVDRRAPVLSMPSPSTVDATGPSGAVVRYTATATDGTDPAPVVACTPASGSRFAIGTTTVSCTATDHAGNRATGTFSVVVRGGQEQLADLIRKVLAYAGVPVAPKAVLVGRQTTCQGLKTFVSVVQALGGKSLPAAVAAEWLADARRIEAVLTC